MTEGSGGRQSLDQVQFVSLLTGEDGSLFVVFNKLFHRVELALSDAVKVFLQLHFEMLVLALCLQGDREVVWLRKRKKAIKGFIPSDKNDRVSFIECHIILNLSWLYCVMLCGVNVRRLCRFIQVILIQRALSRHQLDLSSRLSALWMNVRRFNQTTILSTADIFQNLFQNWHSIKCCASHCLLSHLTWLSGRLACILGS